MHSLLFLLFLRSPASGATPTAAATVAAPAASTRLPLVAAVVTVDVAALSSFPGAAVVGCNFRAATLYLRCTPFEHCDRFSRSLSPAPSSFPLVLVLPASAAAGAATDTAVSDGASGDS